MAQQESMFGPTPLAIQDQLDQQFLAQNSNLDLGSMSARAGLALGNGINGLLGREDPRVTEAKQVQEAVQELRKSGVDMSNPEEYYKKMAGIFGAKGLTAQAEKAAMKALEFQDKAAERDFKTKDRDMQLQIKSQELAIKNAQLAKEVQKAAGKLGGAEFIDMMDKLYKDASVESKTKAFAVFNDTGDAQKAREVLSSKKEDKLDGTTPDGIPVYRSAGGKPYTYDSSGKEVSYFGPIKPTGGITNDMRADNVEQKAAGLEFETRFKNHTAALEAASSVSGEMQKMREILKTGKIITGSQPEIQSSIMRLAGTLGFPLSKEQLETMGNTDTFDAMVTNVILPKMKLLGGNDSEQELKVIRESTGSRKFTPETLGRILEVMEKAVKKRYALEAEYRKHVQAGKGRTNFNFYPEALTTQETPSAVQSSPVSVPAKPTGVPTVSAAPPVITEDRITKYISYVKQLNGKDITREQAIERLKASLPKGQ